MFERETRSESRWKFVWPDVSDIAGADEAVNLGYWGAYIVAGLTTLAAVFGVLGADLWSLIDAGVFALVGFGIQRRSRAAALIGFVLFTGNFVLSLTRGLGFSILALFVFLCLINAVRGTFAYHRLARANQDDATQSHS